MARAFGLAIVLPVLGAMAMIGLSAGFSPLGVAMTVGGTGAFLIGVDVLNRRNARAVWDTAPTLRALSVS